ncbi:uncharacterized protein SRS1_16710 [Sporisorium reilianum f. sp. reilianum]|uniref:Uncharacterized protein n=1 Tax=Sporisorium reilianum f. sp. reilianum TaxID=72559 RepID=A0A2N8UNK5_9BASI|nr:uncharacterized protein SRS1_16710 [Sporisorium reilianum f. sp. reilianum]
MATPNYKHPNFKQQWGLAEDPNAGDHIVTSKGHRLTRQLTAGGHEVDSSQPGFPVYHRRIGNPFPLFCIATGAFSLMLGFVQIRYRGITNPAIVMTLGLPLGMVGNFAACMFAFAEGSTWLATVTGSLAGIIGGASILFLPWTSVQSTYVLGAPNQLAGVAEFYKATALMFFMALIPIFIIFLASLRTSGPVAGAALLIVVALGCLGGGYINGSPNHEVLKASGAFFIMVGVMLFYAATSVMLAEEGLKILPVFPLPRLE